MRTLVCCVVLLTSLAHAIAGDWLRWRGVTHIVCCLGKFDQKNEVCDVWRQAMISRIPEVQYLNWNPSFSDDWKRVCHVFQDIHEAVTSRKNVILFHCINGKDRSPMCLFAYMRLHLNMSAEEGQKALQARVDVNGKPLFDVLDNYALPTLAKELKRLGEFGHVPRSAGRSGKA